MKKANVPLWNLNLAEGTISDLLGTLVAVIFIIACIVPAVSADEPLAASFTFSPDSPKVGDSITFTSTSTGSNITSWAWDFGDGITANGQSQTHTYEVVDAYTVELTISNVNGTDSFQNPVPVSVQDAPVAGFSGTPLSGEAPLTVTFSDDSEGYNIINWEWDFGDGNSTSTEQNPSYEYSSEGGYTVTLTVTNDGGSDTETQTGYITVTSAEQPPVASFNTDVTTGAAPLTVEFTDISQAFGGASIVAWNWDFGDESAFVTDQHPEHIYSSVGTYTVHLTVTDDAGQSSSGTKTITVENPLYADFSISPSSPDANVSVSFTDSSDGDPGDWEWDFGDNKASFIQNPSHTFTSDGTYDVELTIKKAGGFSDTITKTITIGEGTPAPTGDKPTASFTWSPSSPVVGSPVLFTDTSTGEGIDQWKWDFDDKMDFSGNRYSTLQDPSHTYENVGNYMVTLTVWNDGGSTIISKTVTVVTPTPTTPVPQTTSPTPTPTSTAAVAATAPTPTPTPAVEGGFVDGEYRKMTGLYNEYIRILFGFLGMDDEPDFLIIAVN